MTWSNETEERPFLIILCTYHFKGIVIVIINSEFCGSSGSKTHFYTCSFFFFLLLARSFVF
ncbi:hypothetical protein HanRHA438_Chr01g0009041 [Helianthus annuus]|uniref:Uncharacterized protein n=1 Tax=Helianthus annuus TaxID=4232 RepID=A0A9K3JTK7_HELAN|nr:hypothetical protein HanXRQr2_Chr01g0008781 [Helianthus annuus]KAJ0621534.1 hypothetical protein HanIR_Chr01g0009701 [Helianthus annuus]KAJ0946897.1 hypothetical protein HanRHA438_Chr01g0009041 [Helianthus annuus]KAJ0955921.1 hypothetical protein HanPSC8_Chr01g0008511 [Helianthus annuus]